MLSRRFQCKLCAVAQVTSQPLSGVRLSGESGTGSRFTSDCTAFVTVHGFCGSSVIHMIQLVSFSEVFHLLSHVKSGHYQIAFSRFARTDRSRGAVQSTKNHHLFVVRCIVVVHQFMRTLSIVECMQRQILSNCVQLHIEQGPLTVLLVVS